jgi:hypothetical protein
MRGVSLDAPPLPSGERVGVRAAPPFPEAAVLPSSVSASPSHLLPRGEKGSRYPIGWSHS